MDSVDGDSSECKTNGDADHHPGEGVPDFAKVPELARNIQLAMFDFRRIGDPLVTE
jgi:hypothetical protein